MYRNLSFEIKEWLKKETPKPLILRGARQVGKSTLVRMIANEENLDLLEINLEKKKISEFDNEEDLSIDKVIKEIEIISRKKVSSKTLIFLDEIQAQASAINSLRYFYEDRPGLRVIAAGSLLETVINSSKYGMPVGRVEYLYLGPMTFTEFLLALNEEILAEQIKQLSLKSPPSTSLHKRAIELLKEFYFVGGMPEAVREYSNTRDFDNVRDIQNNLIQTYKDDIPKYAKTQDFKHLLAVLNYCAHNLGKKVIFSKISKGIHSSKLRLAIDLLAQAGVLRVTYHNESNGLPLPVGINQDIFKLYFIDIGLYNSLLETRWSDLYNLSPDKLLIKGNIAEQFIAQHLAFRFPKKELSQLFYWLRGGKINAAEVDFILSHNSNIFPLEVKSGSSGRLKSLWQFIYEHKLPYALRADLSVRKQSINEISQYISTDSGSKEVKCKLIGLPLYAIEIINQFLDEIGQID